MIDDLELARTLLERGLATREQLRQARQLQLSYETSLYLAIIEHDVLEEALMVELVADRLNLPFVRLEGRPVPEQTVELVPGEMARAHSVLPLELRQDASGALLLLAMCDPLDIMAMDEVSSHLNAGIQPVLSGPRDLLAAIEDAYTPKSHDELDGFGAEQEQEDALATEDSWASFFDEALAQPEPSSAEQMRDRNRTMALDLMDIDEVLSVEEAIERAEAERRGGDDDPLSLLDVPGEPSSAQMDEDLVGWDVDSSLKPIKPPPPPPFPPASPPPPAGASPLKPAEPERGDPEGQEEEDAFDSLYAAIDEETPRTTSSDSAASGTVIAAPSKSMVEGREFSEPQEIKEEEEDLQPPALDEELMISDEAGSQTQMGGLGHLLEGSEHGEVAPSSPRDHRLSLGNEAGTFTTLATPKRLNADGSERPMLVIEEGEDEELFSRALADIDARDEPEEEEAPELEPSAALGRLKLKRVAVQRSSGPLTSPVVETSSRIVEQQDVSIETVFSSHAPEAPSPQSSELSSESSEGLKDIFDDDDILAGFQSALEESDQEEEAQQDHRTPLPPGMSRGDLSAKRDPEVEHLFDFTGDGEDGLDEATNAALGEAHARIERLNNMIRSANQSVLGDQGTDGQAEAGGAASSGPTISSRGERETSSNRALTRDSLDKMRQSTVDLSSELLFSGTNSPGLPEDIDDSRLLRAALLILISQNLIKIDELVALARSLPEQPGR